MKKILSALKWAVLMLSLAPAAHAAPAFFAVAISSGLSSGVCVTTGTTIRIDNWVQGTQVAANRDRIGFEIQHLGSANDFYYDYDATFSTTTATTAEAAIIGHKVVQEDIRFIAARWGMVVHAMAVDAAAACVWIRTEQIIHDE